jgi:hypothetical protein
VRFGHDRDTAERVEPVDFGLVWDVGAPTPHLIQAEHRAFLAFYLSEPDPTWDGTWVRVVSPSDGGESGLGVIEWLRCGGAVLGGLNDEAFHGHPLWKHGLEDSPRRGYASAEVLGSRWIGEWEEANRVHDYHSPKQFADYRHFILQFHDSTFECVAKGFISYRTRLSMPSLLAELARRVVDDRPLDFDLVARQPAEWKPEMGWDQSR